MTELSKATEAAAVAPRDLVVITLPASSAYLSVLRTATAGLAARLDFTIDEIEDLRIAVDEACAMLLSQAISGADITCEFTLDLDRISVAVSVLTRDGEEPSHPPAWGLVLHLCETHAGPPFGARHRGRDCTDSRAGPSDRRHCPTRWNGH